MYKDNGKINVELLAEVGDIAHRLRNLDKRLALDLNDPRYLQQAQHYQGAAHCSTERESKSPDTEPACSERRPSLAAKFAQDISDRLNASASASNTADASSPSLPSTQSQEEPQPQPQYQPTRRYSSKLIEDIILEFYEKHLIYHQQLESERLTNATTQSLDQPTKSRIYRLTDGDPDNMSNLSASTDPGNCSSSNFSNIDSENAVRNLDSENSSIDRASKPNESTTSELTAAAAAVAPTTSGGAAAGKRNSLANQPMPEIQISNSDEQPKKHKSLSEQLPQNESKEPTTIESNEEQQPHEATPSPTLATSTIGGICGHYCAGWQSPSWSNQLDDNILLTLVMELKHKVEFTERMNWLCKYPFLYVCIGIM